MAKEFFSSWEIWEKLLFILACALVVTVCIGCLKLLYTHWHLRKCSAVVELERQESAMHRQRSQRRRNSVSPGNGSDDMPFGIRAIERGIEVEGVWISRSNSPDLSATKDSSAASSMLDQVPRKDINLDLEKQDSRTRSRSISSTASAHAVHPHIGRTASAERTPRNGMSRDSSPDGRITKPPRAKYPPLSYSRYQANPYLFRRQSNTTTTLYALESTYKTSGSMHGEDTSNSDSSNQSNNTDDSGPISTSAPALLTNTSRPRPRQQSSSDLELLNRHRTSQVAETGQLTPRGRRPGKAFSDGSTRTRRDSASLERPEYFSTTQRVAQPTSGNASPTTPTSPKLAALPAAVRRSSMPDVTPFTEFCKRTSQHARPESLTSRSSRDSAQPNSPKHGAQSPRESAPSSPIIPASEGAAEMKLPVPQPSKKSFEHTISEHTSSQVVRGLGTGFEILRPGSLKAAAPNENMMERQQDLPPVPLQNSARTRRSSTCSTETSKKLRKKRFSVNSLASSETSRFSRISLFS